MTESIQLSTFFIIQKNFTVSFWNGYPPIQKNYAPKYPKNFKFLFWNR